MPRNRRMDAPRGGHPAAAASTRPGRPVHAHAERTVAGRGEIRIIGGEWRGRKLHFPSTSNLRPTPDRVRETVFNWLQFEIAGKRCLDLFAGSGALGFEALSRGASAVVFVERDPAAADSMRHMLDSLRCDRGRVERQDAFGFLAAPPPRQPFDIVFLDPPYDERWLERACDALEQGEWLAPSAWIYLEDAAARGEPRLPSGWALVRSKRAGDVGYHLARRGTAATPATTKQKRGA